MKLAAILGPVMQVLRLVRLDRVFDIYGDLEFARQSFHEPPPPEELLDQTPLQQPPFNSF